MTELLSGVVHESAGGRYRVRLQGGSFAEATLRGRLKKSGRRGQRVVIGDEVSVRAGEDAWTIEEVADRSTELVRRGRGGRTPKVLAANLDQVFAVTSVAEPRASLELIDRLLVLCETSGMRPSLVLNKADLEGARDVAHIRAELYEGIGYDVFITSAESGLGIEDFKSVACSGSSALIGPSGVGKSSILNAIDPELDLKTGALSRKTGTGRHTTVGSRLIELGCGGTVADTPGFGDVTLWGVEAEGLGACFPDFDDFRDACRFRGCTHLHEPDCAVLAAVERGEIESTRHRSYQTLFAEAREG